MGVDLPDEFSLEQIENSFWGAAPEGSSYLVSTVHRLRSEPIGLLSTEDLRIVIGQNIGLEVLLPVALERMMCEPLTEGDFYPGDLLAAVLRVSGEHWKSHADQHQAVEQIIQSLEDSELSSGRRRAVANFRRRL